MDGADSSRLEGEGEGEGEGTEVGRLASFRDLCRREDQHGAVDREIREGFGRFQKTGTFFECWFWSMILIGFRLQVQDHEDERTARRVELEARRVESEARRVELEAAKAEIVLLKRQLQEVGVQQE